MTLQEAIRASQPSESRCDHLPIRRAVWAHGNRIQWFPGEIRWKFANSSTTAPLTNPRAGIPLELEQSQRCLTPESMLADDWEVVQP